MWSGNPNTDKLNAEDSRSPAIHHRTASVNQSKIANWRMLLEHNVTQRKHNADKTNEFYQMHTYNHIIRLSTKQNQWRKSKQNRKLEDAT